MKTKMPIVKLDFYKLDYAEKMKYADLFCEGSEELYSLLFFLWDNKINTYGCCIGHGNNKFDIPYISFDVCNVKKEDMYKIIKNCYGVFFENIEISGILSKNDNCIKRMIVFSFKSFDLLQNNRFFDYLKAIISKNMSNEIYDFDNVFSLPKNTEYYINDLSEILYFDKDKLHNVDELKDIKEIQINNKRILIKSKITSPSHLINIKNKIWAKGERDVGLRWTILLLWIKNI